MITADAFVQKFQLEPHPEGGFYKRTHLEENELFSSIVFLLTKNNFSAFHRIQSDEQWNWYYGDAIVIHEIDAIGNYTKTILSDININFQYIVKKDNWFASECEGKNGFAFCGCTVVPAFSFDTFELGNRTALINKFPSHKNIIERLTR